MKLRFHLKSVFLAIHKFQNLFYLDTVYFKSRFQYFHKPEPVCFPTNVVRHVLQ